MPKILGGLLCAAGLVLAVAPFLVSPPDDELFLYQIRQAKEPGEWTTGGTIHQQGRSYTYSLEQIVVEGGEQPATVQPAMNRCKRLSSPTRGRCWRGHLCAGAVIWAEWLWRSSGWLW